MHHTRAAILSVGDELTLGQTLDTNSKWFSEQLRDMGIMPIEHVTVPDDVAAQTAAFARLASIADLIICSGGLGPTLDDLTRQALAAAAHDTLIEDPEALEQVRAWFAGRKYPMPEMNRVQALRPTRGRCIPNAAGTAPGLYIQLNTATKPCDVFCLPGPPSELRPMFEAHVRPHLRPPEGRTVQTRVLHTFGIGESALARLLDTMMSRDHVPMVGTTASGGVVSVRIRYEGPLDAAAARQLLDATEAKVRALAGSYIFGAGDDTLPGAVLAAARGRSHTIGVVESCTGGLLGKLLTDTPGSSDVFAGGFITYSNRLKTLLAGVSPALLESHGAVSREVALAMAEGARERLGTDHALAITGIAGPDGAVPATDARPAKPVGLVYIARASLAAPSEVRRFQMVGDRESVRLWAARSALAMLWRHLAQAPAIKFLREVE
ncbi:MAG: competence/damage-inducible protein A [Tepidisphaera sp.]|nr:competence/damage-inducible protein A [Tepidisphaera sp.]